MQFIPGQTAKTGKGWEEMSLSYIRNYYHVPAFHGRLVRLPGTGEQGQIVGAKGPYLRVRVISRIVLTFHPMDVEYLACDK